MSDYITITRSHYEALLADVRQGIELCDVAARLRVELAGLARRLRELDQDLTPVNPRGQSDAEAAFDASVEYASGRRPAPSAEQRKSSTSTPAAAVSDPRKSRERR